jgi:hypothetical protein
MTRGRGAFIANPEQYVTDKRRRVVMVKGDIPTVAECFLMLRQHLNALSITLNQRYCEHVSFYLSAHFASLYDRR